MAKAEKVSTVAEITEKFRSSNAAVITEYRGLTMAQLTELRRSLGGDTAYTVAKNTLVKRAAAEAGVEGLDDLFVGPTAVAFVSGEPVDAAKALRDFAKAHPLLVIKVVCWTAVRWRPPRSPSWPTWTPARSCWPSSPAR